MAMSKEQIENLCRKRPVRMVEGGAVMTGPVRLSFPSLHKKSGIQGGVQKYNALGLFPHTNVGPLHAALVALVKQSYPNITDPSVLLNPKDKNHPLKDQGLRVSVNDGGYNAVGKTSSGFVVGLPFINPKSGQAVPCYQVVGGAWKSVMPEEIESVFYPGCWVDMKIGMGKSTASANPGVSLYLNGVWKLADDEKLSSGGASAAPDEGGSTEDAVAIEDPNAALGASGGGWGGQPATSQWD